MAQLLTINAAQLLTIKNGLFSIFGLLKCAETPIFTVFFEHHEHHPKIAKKWTQKKR